MTREVSWELEDLRAFVEESNRIEGIHHLPTDVEIAAHIDLLDAKRLSVPKLERFVSAIAGAELRKRIGMDVRVGNHHPPPDDSHMPWRLKCLLDHTQDTVQGSAWNPYDFHLAYESLHPFMDGNGRSGRAIWAWQMLRLGRDPFALPFLHRWYYSSLDGGRGY